MDTLPLYLCHKHVRAIKIHSIVASSLETKWFIEPAEKRFAPIEVSQEYIDKHHPEPGGYFVVYQDGYRSFSPAGAFESGYEKVEG